MFVPGVKCMSQQINQVLIKVFRSKRKQAHIWSGSICRPFCLFAAAVHQNHLYGSEQTCHIKVPNLFKRAEARVLCWHAHLIQRPEMDDFSSSVVQTYWWSLCYSAMLCTIQSTRSIKQQIKQCLQHPKAFCTVLRLVVDCWLMTDVWGVTFLLALAFTSIILSTAPYTYISLHVIAYTTISYHCLLQLIHALTSLIEKLFLVFRTVILNSA